MSEEYDRESRTEEPTEKKISDTLKKGSLPISREVATIALFLCFLLLANFVLRHITGRLIYSLGLMLSGATEFRFDNGSDAGLYLTTICVEAAYFLLPILAGFLCAGIAASCVQGAPSLIFERIAPKLSRISISEGARRIVGTHAVIEFAKIAVKIGVAAGAVAYALRTDRGVFIDVMRTEPRFIGEFSLKIIVDIVGALCVPLAVYAIVDVLWIRLKWRQDIRMSRQEIKEEMKQAEGDPIVKAKLRSLSLSRSRKRMIAAVPRATFVIANPTHYAIALRYIRSEGGAPLVVAKGKDLIALRIREIAERHGIPVLEERALVRSMFDQVEVDRMIPTEFYRPVAELIHVLNAPGARRAMR